MNHLADCIPGETRATVFKLNGVFIDISLESKT